MTFDYAENFLELEISMEVSTTLLSLLIQRCHGQLRLCATTQGSESSLINRLQKSLEAETLDGDNQYRCSRCDQLRDARRSVQIDSVPPTLNFSLLRFVFDPKTFDRKKSKTTIKFPPRINMRPYMSDTEGKELWYELKGVIEHKGTSVSINPGSVDVVLILTVNHAGAPWSLCGQGLR